MGHFIMKTGKKVIEGTMDPPAGEMELEQKAASLIDQKDLRNISIPFLLMRISFAPDTDTPYTITHIAPDYYAYYEFDPGDFIRLVRGREEHRDNAYKLVYVSGGELIQRVESQLHKYSTGSCFLLNQNVRHNEELYGGHKEGKNYLDFIPLDSSPGSDRVGPLFHELAELIQHPSPGCSFLFKNLICRIFINLSDRQQYTTTPLELGSEAEGRLFTQITDILEQHNGRIRREQLTKELNYNGNYLNRIVKKYTGMNITQYATNIAMKRAAWMLLHSDATISEIIDELGYTNRTIFYNAFEEVYGETPRQYRSKNNSQLKKDSQN